MPWLEVAFLPFPFPLPLCFFWLSSWWCESQGRLLSKLPHTSCIRSSVSMSSPPFLGNVGLHREGGAQCSLPLDTNQVVLEPPSAHHNGREKDTHTACGEQAMDQENPNAPC